jgi:16S rRNA (guanine527-N7)-methyltransferase
VVCERSEAWAAEAPPAGGREAYDAVAVRAVGRLSTLAELASPLLREGGALVAWKGRRDAEEEAEVGRAASRLAMEPVEVRWVGPYAGSRNRHLHVMRKAGSTPGDLPRRPGIAKKRPFGAT